MGEGSIRLTGLSPMVEYFEQCVTFPLVVFGWLAAQLVEKQLQGKDIRIWQWGSIDLEAHCFKGCSGWVWEEWSELRQVALRRNQTRTRQALYGHNNTWTPYVRTGVLFTLPTNRNHNRFRGRKVRRRMKFN